MQTELTCLKRHRLLGIDGYDEIHMPRVDTLVQHHHLATKRMAFPPILAILILEGSSNSFQIWHTEGSVSVSRGCCQVLNSKEI